MQRTRITAQSQPGAHGFPFGYARRVVAAPRVRYGVMSEVIFVVEEAAEGGYTARALGASIFTEADTLPALHDQIRDAVRCHFDEGQAPKVVRLHFVREELLAV